MERGRWGALIGLALTLLLLGSAPALAQDWHGSIGAGYAWQNVIGNEESFWTQTYEREGFWLDELTLSYAPGGDDRFRLNAFGFGGAEPTRTADLWWKVGGDWEISLSYDRRASYFSLNHPDFSRDRDDWHISRYKGRVAWDGWSFAKLSLDLNYTHRGGFSDRPLYGLNDFYGWRTEYDRSLREGVFRLETKTLPVHILFEQAYSVYEREDRWSPIRALNMKANDPDLLAGLSKSGRDKQTVPTSRVVLTYANPRFEVAADLLYSHAKLDADALPLKTFAIGGGSIGKVSYMDQVMGSARQDTFAADLRLGIDLGANWFLRLSGDYRDSDMDSDLLGTRLIRMSSPYATVDFGYGVDESSKFSVEDLGGDITLEYRGRRFSGWGGFFTASREVTWLLPDRDPNLDRDTDGFLAGFSYRIAGKVRFITEYKRGDFEKYIFRTQPHRTESWDFRLDTELGGGWTADAHARTEKSTNPDTVANLLHHNNALGVAVRWGQREGRSGVSLEFERLKVTTETGIVLPDGMPEMSVYGLNMYTFQARGFWKVGPVTLDADFLHVQDRGATWPLVSWTAYGGLTWAGPCGSEVSVFIRHRDYNEDRASRDDFEVTRYGLVVRWRF